MTMLGLIETPGAFCGMLREHPFDQTESLHVSSFAMICLRDQKSWMNLEYAQPLRVS
jgi:hypothetical protein